MSKLFITGDTHGDIDISKLTSRHFSVGKELTCDDYVIICGDAGIVWDGDRFDKYIQNWYDSKPWTTLFVSGNHENYEILDSLPVSEWHGGKVHRISDKIIHLMHGQIFDICGYSIFTMGGAKSIDRIYRVNLINWWEHEMPTQEEYDEAMANMSLHGDEVDIIISHTAPDSYLDYLCNFTGLYEHDKLTNFLEIIRLTSHFKKWFCGHLHKDRDLDSRFSVLYNTVVEITDEMMDSAPTKE